ncbi:hypothetical protein BW425_16940 [Bacillus pseudomycoides]|uniref:Uncharacterized protein n=1 Tax=Bacillus pseudomycoides TaxID=64104 RepID=A0A1Y3MC77_9BACI|nr:hypothetical protein BW425_16940 [Bacillus pseudomycoides]
MFTHTSTRVEPRVYKLVPRQKCLETSFFYLKAEAAKPPNILAAGARSHRKAQAACSRNCHSTSTSSHRPNTLTFKRRILLCIQWNKL